MKRDEAAPSGNREPGWGSDVAAEMLRRLGIKYITHNPGSSFRGLHDSIVNFSGNADPSLLLCLNENQAIAIAHGYAKASGEPMGCILHANVGLLSSAMAIFNASVDRVPVYIVGAGGPADSERRVPWIHWIHSSRDQAALVRPFTKWDDEPRSVGAMVESMLRANILARTAPKGPVYICLDALLQEDELRSAPELPDVARYAAPAAAEPPPEAIAQAADMLLSARSPFILAGRVSRDRDAWERRVELAERLGARVATDLKTAAAFPTDHPLHVGLSYHFRGAAKDAALEADVILGLDWIDLGSAIRGNYDGRRVTAKVIECSVDPYLHRPETANYFKLSPRDLPIQADPDITVLRLLEEVRRRTGSARPAYSMGTPAPDRMSDAEEPISIADIGRAVHAARAGREITVARLPLGFAAETCHFAGPMDFLGNDGGAGIGSGPGMTFGAALALLGSGRLVLGVIGDGDFLQGSTALWTAAHYDIPALLIVANNRSHLNDELIQERVALQRGRNVDNRWIGQRIDDPPVDIVAIARGYGVAAESVATVGDLHAAIARGLDQVASGKPYVIDAATVQGGATRLAEFRPQAQPVA